MIAEAPVNILIVDDRPENLLAIESILADLGQNLVRANSGREALRYLLSETFALILLDVQMPDLNGFELAEMIRQREHTARTPIIFVSAAAKNEQYIFKGYSLGAVDYLTKPLEPEILRSKVRFFTELFQQNQEIKRQAALLERANAELDSINAELESRVQNRTAQLEAANRELENEIITRKQAEALLAAEHAITRTLAESDNFEIAAPEILRHFCEHLKASVSCLWMPDKTGKFLTCAFIETANGNHDLKSFVNKIRHIKVERGVGLAGHVWQRNAPVWLAQTMRSDVADARSKEFPRASFAATFGLNSAVGFPIRINLAFSGVIEFFTKHTLASDQLWLNMLEAAGSEIGQFIQRKRVEAERENLLRREKSLREAAETASRMKDEFLATVSHELRTPLNAILGWCQMMQGGKLDAADFKRALETINRNARSQAQLIDDLLDTSRLITGNLRLSLTPTAIKPIIESSLDTVRPAAESKNIQITAIYNSEIEAITCDAHRFQQMIWNLLTNAVKFTNQDGTIEIRLEQTGDQVQISIKDSGQGIAHEFLPFVFDRFRQADGSSTRRHGGLGLGLAIVRHLAELHGGSIRAESAGIGKGATFVLTLPSLTAIAKAPAETAAREVEAYQQNGHHEPQLEGLRILVVEDDDDTREMIAFALSSWGATPRCAASVAEAFAQLAEWLPDIVLSDLSMPGEDGFALIEKLRRQTDGDANRIPAIALTAHARPEDNQQAISAGFQLHLAKPIDTNKLAEAIVSVTEKRSRISV